MIDNRIDVRWGDVSLVKAELNLMSAALKHGQYDYFHLISGVDLPLKSNNEIDKFFSNDKAYIYISGKKSAQVSAQNRLNRYHLLTRHYRFSNEFVRLGVKVVRIMLESIVNLFLRRDKFDWKYGSQWFSIPRDCCEHIVSKRDWVLKRFRYSYCSDELFVQSILWHSQFKSRIESYPTRFIDWDRGGPYVWGQDKTDFTTLINSDKLFARKFDIRKNPKIIESIYNYITEQNQKQRQ